MEAKARREVRQTSRPPATGAMENKDSEGNETKLEVVKLDGMLDYDSLVPKNLTTTRSDLEKRLCLRLPRLLCVNKQYPRSCGISSLTSVYNYLYSSIGESEVGSSRPPVSQEELMTILGFEPPFGEIPWGGFTGNATLMRWFHAANRHFGLKGRAYILYKAHARARPPTSTRTMNKSWRR
ncbi:hypothetical protein AGDE_13653 [Angomonas deanei]|uniref:Uncharacterized protein n=1 Tax=Angomonas deanei TaxID=59799 RepID=A0A7G2CPG5_9TRYP|nr:hypothetical protein AGDE_13653 [Angomonas deanei]CAD2220072.1 hypothetical protein, conserved [Angomonas deanei]|eukprot:EPY21935.1 hypothetical protein AGDE_13653 [Angomonas deanei]